VNQTIDIRNISTHDLAALGVQQLAYIKPVLHNQQPAFAIHAADGTLVALSLSRSAAEALVRQNDLDPVSVH
jgi:hypothetical protein